MRSHNSGFENSLACLQHPLTLLSIAVLLLNDHVLKVISPSWLTGKLSDFAGLFFFPFILTAGLSLVLSKFDLSRQRIGQIAFGIVAIWFVLLKTTPFVNLLTAQFTSLFFGAPVQIILDPTDVVALVVLWPAWMMWLQPLQIKPTRFAYVALSIGAMAVMASSSIEDTVHNVTNLEYGGDGIVYAADRVTFSSSSYPVVQSLDGGATWEYGTINKTLEKRLPVQYCSHQKTDYCIRVTNSRELMESFDNGAHWRRLPIRYIIIPKDLILFEWEGKEYVIVAIGEQGILRRELPDGEWNQVVVRGAGENLLYISDIWSALSVVKRELIVWLGVAFLALLITHVAIWDRLASEKSIKYLTKWLMHSVEVIIGFFMVEATMVFLVVGLLVFSNYPSFLDNWSGTTWDWLERIYIGLAIISPFAWLLMETNKWILKETPDQAARRRIVLYCALTVIGVYLIGALLWPLWAVGVIERHQMALAISVLVSGLITASGCYLIRNAK
jgi:hypothetical protein